MKKAECLELVTKHLERIRATGYNWNTLREHPENVRKDMLADSVGKIIFEAEYPSKGGTGGDSMGIMSSLIFAADIMEALMEHDDEVLALIMGQPSGD